MLQGEQQSYRIQVVDMSLAPVMTQHGKELPYRNIRSRPVFETVVKADNAKVALRAFRSEISNRQSGAK